jgi:PTH1 family peptidyl-tRNA hydrolase
MLILIGLGNIGSEYKNTPHNIGFDAIDKIAEYYNVSNWEKKFKGEILIFDKDILGQNEKIALIKPSTYMNKSGECVCLVKNFFKCKIDDIFVFHDDIDIKIGKIKVKTGGGNAGHNGLKSLDSKIGKNYHRIRIGVDNQNEYNSANYVLNKFKKEEKDILDDKINLIIKFLDILLEKKIIEFGSNINQK